MDNPFLPCNPPDKEHVRLERIDREALESGIRIHALVFLKINPVVDHMQPLGTDLKEVLDVIFVSRETAMTASAISRAVFSTQQLKSYPPPSCSRFHGRSGSRECTVITIGMS